MNKQLKDDYIAAHKALGEAIKALQVITPNLRDYPDADSCSTAREQHFARLAALKDMQQQLVKSAAAV